MPKVWMPNKHGHYKEVEIPKYLDEVLFDRRWGHERLRIRNVHDYWYRIYGWDKLRKAYGIEKDIAKLKHFLDRFSTFDDGTSLENITGIKFHKEPKNYYVTFKMVDPFAFSLEKAGLIDMNWFRRR